MKVAQKTKVELEALLERLHADRRFVEARYELQVKNIDNQINEVEKKLGISHWCPKHGYPAPCDKCGWPRQSLPEQEADK